jgi:hypothetical protein
MPVTVPLVRPPAVSSSPSPPSSSNEPSVICTIASSRSVSSRSLRSTDGDSSTGDAFSTKPAFAATMRAGASFTGLTVIAIVSVSVAVPSVVATVSVSAPLKSRLPV